ncbi:CAP domain-containing protein [Clostridium sp. UBA6640]|uniref:CAP domain-containing protein n=1 Tax=Clostridium sp. UBA6640 TaxID=1946370 RepID=UPI0025BB4560|nr:CAP domain-containing protein [Clostridium sp. UBA6640]
MLRRKNNVVVMLIALAAILGGCSNAKQDTETSIKDEIQQESKITESKIKNDDKKDVNNGTLGKQVSDNKVESNKVEDNKNSTNEAQQYTVAADKPVNKPVEQSKPVTDNKKVEESKKPAASPVKEEAVNSNKDAAKPTPNPAPKPSPKPETETTNNAVKSGNYEYLNAVEDEVLRLCNIEREKQGLAPLVMEEKLRGIARIKSAEMLEHNFFDHNSPISGSPSNLMKINGYTNWTASGENIQMSQGRAKSSVTASYIVGQWMNSPGHRANILSKEFKKIGVGIVFRDSDLKAYETQLFSN